jgi:hypothetical protein
LAQIISMAQKDVYRSTTGDMPLLRYVADALRRVQARLGLAPEPETTTVGSTGPKLTRLRQLGEEMALATRRAAEQGLAVTERAAPAARRYLELVETALKER